MANEDNSTENHAGSLDPFEPINIIEGTDGADTLTGTDKMEGIYGRAGNDELYGGDGNDFLHGNTGDDILNGGGDFDCLNGGPGNDTMSGGAGKDIYMLDSVSGHDVITDFDPKEDTIHVRSKGIKFEDLKSEHSSEGLKVSWGENSVLLKGVAADLSEDWFLVFDSIIIDIPIELGGSDTYNRILGTELCDILVGGGGLDNLYGNDGNDMLKGGGGEDYLFGGRGNDTMSGGAGADVFFFTPVSGHDTITDFDTSEDALDFVGANLEFADISSKQEHGGTTLSWGENSVFLNGVTEPVNESWFDFNLPYIDLSLLHIG